jgi:hypothetical protein
VSKQLGMSRVVLSSMELVGYVWMKCLNAYKLLVGKPEGTRALGRPRRRWLDNIRMDLVEVGWGDVD